MEGKRERQRKLVIRQQNTHRLNETHNSRSLLATCVKMAVNSGIEYELNGAKGRSANIVRYGLLNRA